jgi:hypothetical protein
MSWASLVANETVTFAEANNAIAVGAFVGLAGFSSTAECMTKSDASTYLNVDTSYAPFAALASNELVVKSNLRTVGYYTYIVSQGYATANQCYGIGEAYQTLYAAESDWLSVTYFYTDTALTNVYVGANVWHGSADAGNSYGYGTVLRIFTTGAVTAQFAC